MDWRREGHGGGDWTESSRSLQVKSLTSEQRNSCLFFQLLLLLFRKSCLSLLAECSVTAGPLDRWKMGGGWRWWGRKEMGENEWAETVRERRGERMTGNHVFTVPWAALKTKNVDERIGTTLWVGPPTKKRAAQARVYYEKNSNAE